MSYGSWGCKKYLGGTFAKSWRASFRFTSRRVKLLSIDRRSWEHVRVKPEWADKWKWPHCFSVFRFIATNHGVRRTSNRGRAKQNNEVATVPRGTRTHHTRGWPHTAWRGAARNKVPGWKKPWPGLPEPTPSREHLRGMPTQNNPPSGPIRRGALPKPPRGPPLGGVAT